MGQRLWYDKPAGRWEEALPIGNGRLGGMIFGTVSRERVQMNEDSVWYGGPHGGNHPDASKYLPEIRELLAQGKQLEAEHLTRMALMSSPKYMYPYQPLGDLQIWLLGHEGAVEQYNRELDLEKAVARVRYSLNGVNYVRESFSTAVDQVMVIRFTASSPGSLSFGVHLMRRPFDVGTEALSEGLLLMRGECGRDGIQFVTAVKAEIKGGCMKAIGDFLSVEQADEVTLYVATNTTFRVADPEAKALTQIKAAAELGFDSLLERHLHDYVQHYKKVTLELGSAESDEELKQFTTDQRLQQFKDGAQDPGLISLFFQYGRYLLLSCSRPGSLPANLQGIWNDSFTPPWESKYTININIQMNYWIAELGNLSSCHQPLFEHLERMVEKGRKTAKEVYGCRGFVAHHNTNLWGDTAVEGVLVTSSIWPMGGAWLSLHLWEHYRFGMDLEFLAKRAYPIMKEAALFFLDYMTEDDQGRLLTGPSLSPENRFLLPNGASGTVCMGPSMDSQIVYMLWKACIEASQLLGEDEGFRSTLEQSIKKLPQPRVGKYGQIMEWLEDYDEVDPGHRHISQLFALHPGEQIHVRRSPELAMAARRTIERRLENGGGHTGWSRAWIINFWARLEDGEEAHFHLKELLAKSVYPNLFDAHPPFQIDGNFGGAAGIAEMLLQSHAGELTLLPALPSAWENGKVTGLRARGGYEVDIEWAEGSLTTARIRAGHSGTCRVRYADNIFEFPVTSGEVYEITPPKFRKSNKI